MSYSAVFFGSRYRKLLFASLLTVRTIAGDVVLHQVLTHLKHRVDSQVLSNSHLMDNEPYFMQGMFPMIKQELDAQHLKYSAAQIKYIGTCISNEYFTERNFAS